MKAELKTKARKASVTKFLAAIKDEQRREDCRKLSRLMSRATGARPKMWGPAIVGYGDYHYVYASGREGDWFLAGFSPRKGDLTLYIMGDYRRFPALMKKLGRHRTGKSCLYLRQLADVDAAVLEQLIAQSTASLVAGQSPAS